MPKPLGSSSRTPARPLLQRPRVEKSVLEMGRDGMDVEPAQTWMNAVNLLHIPKARPVRSRKSRTTQRGGLAPEARLELTLEMPREHAEGECSKTDESASTSKTQSERGIAVVDFYL